MSRSIYLLLVSVRLYFATCLSYIHPDEHFQGPEIVAGIHMLLSTPLHMYISPSSDWHSRRGLWMADVQDMGVHIRPTHPQHLPVVAGVQAIAHHIQMAL